MILSFLEKGLKNVENALEELEKISPLDISSEKVKLICNKQEIKDDVENII